MKNFLPILLISSFFIGCSSNDDEVMLEDATPILPMKSTSDSGETTTLKYDGDKLSQINYMDSKDVFVYDGDNIIRDTEYNLSGNVKRVWEYFYNSKNQLSKIIQTNPDSSTPETTTITWINDNHFQYKRTPNTTGLVSDGYITNGNITRIVSVDKNGSTNTNNYSFDTKNNPTKNIKGYSKINIIYPQDGSVNNVIKEESKYISSNYSSNSNYLYTLTYNPNNFPTKNSSTYNSSNGNQNTETTVIEYNK